MLKIKELIKSPHIQISLATGLSILAMAFASKYLLPEPISYFKLSIPALMIVVYEIILEKYKNSRICTAWYWVVAVLVITALIILGHMI